MIINSSKWDRIFRMFEALTSDERTSVSALYIGNKGMSADVCSEDMLEECLRTMGHLAPELMMTDGAVEYEDAMAADEIVANLTSERNQ